MWKFHTENTLSKQMNVNYDNSEKINTRECEQNVLHAHTHKKKEYEPLVKAL